MIETLTITGTKKESLSSAIKMLQSQAMNKTIAGYRVDNDNLLFYYHEGCKGCENKFPYDLNLETAIDFMWGWIENTDPKEKPYGGDGDNVKGFILEYGEFIFKTTDENSFPNFDDCFMRIKPTWIYYGK